MRLVLKDYSVINDRANYILEIEHRPNVLERLFGVKPSTRFYHGTRGLWYEHGTEKLCSMSLRDKLRDIVTDIKENCPKHASLENVVQREEL